MSHTKIELSFFFIGKHTELSLFQNYYFTKISYVLPQVSYHPKEMFVACAHHDKYKYIVKYMISKLGFAS